MGNLSHLRDYSSAHIRTATYMSKRRDRVCGADVHKDLIVATILGDDETSIKSKFGTTGSELDRFKDWLISNNCEQVAFEATGVYWIPVYDSLSSSIDTIVANPWQIKTIPNDKSDSKDASRIAVLCLNGQIKRSQIFTDDEYISKFESGITWLISRLRSSEECFESKLYSYNHILEDQGMNFFEFWQGQLQLRQSVLSLKTA
jgi:hypothetical protein